MSLPLEQQHMVHVHADNNNWHHFSVLTVMHTSLPKLNKYL